MGGISPADPPVASLLSHPPTLYSEHDSLTHLVSFGPILYTVLQPAVCSQCLVFTAVFSL